VGCQLTVTYFLQAETNSLMTISASLFDFASTVTMKFPAALGLTTLHHFLDERA
jgi:hypothetical protein